MTNAPADTKSNFFRQSGWMMAANVMAGVFMMLVHPFAGNIPDYAVFMTMLRIFVIVTIPASALQTILAQQMAAAITEQQRRDVAATARGLLKWTFFVWLALLVGAAFFQEKFTQTFQVWDPNVLWATMLLIFAALWMPIFQGLLQGLQFFFPLGWSFMVNGVGRVVAIAIGVTIFGAQAAGATFGAFVGVVCATLLAAWPARVVFRERGGTFHWRAFLRKIMPLTFGAGSTLFLINVDMPLVKARFPETVTNFYAAAEAIGIAVVTLCVPVAAVMFPKLVRSRATGASSSALYLAILATAALGGSAALVCTLFPKLPLQIMFFRTPEMVQAHVLIPWFMWAMVPVTMYNVLVNNLIARERYGIIPFSALIPIAYAITLHLFLKNTTLEPFDAFKRVIQILMGFSSALMLVSVYFSRRASLDEAGGGDRSQATIAKPS